MFVLLGCRVGWCAWVMVFMMLSIAFGGVSYRVGVFVWVWWFCGVVGAVGGVGLRSRVVCV